ncbi:hypothetical protein [Arthrobacter psychrolactophilus]|nr:hypothetical protein [Arthrobacter psychrolactophilus]
MGDSALSVFQHALNIVEVLDGDLEAMKAARPGKLPPVDRIHD